jgi:hypothetical protein
MAHVCCLDIEATILHEIQTEVTLIQADAALLRTMLGFQGIADWKYNSSFFDINPKH